MWKWSTGEPYYRSARQEPQLTQQSQGYDSQTNAINQSLADYSQGQNQIQNQIQSQDSDLISITNTMFSRNQNNSGTRREDIDCKMADREMLAQRGVNPFLQTSYVNDIVTRDMFLKPINTTQGRTKQENSGED